MTKTCPPNPVLHPCAGTSMIEVTIFTAVIVPVFVALAATVTIFTNTANEGHDRTLAVSENHKILQKIVAELSMTTTKRDHVDFGSPSMPHDESNAGSNNSVYDMSPSDGMPAMDETHNAFERDGIEYWHPEWEKRRFYIYCTTTAFDTIEFQKVRTDQGSASHINVAAGTVSQPWSARRKICLVDNSVVLKIRRDGIAEPRTITLGTHVSDLKFHVNPDGHIIIRLTTSVGVDDLGNGGVSSTTQITVNPRNGLS